MVVERREMGKTFERDQSMEVCLVCGLLLRSEMENLVEHPQAKVESHDM